MNEILTGLTLAQIVLKSTVLLEKSNCIADGIVCDGASTNRKLWTEFGVCRVHDYKEFLYNRGGVKGNVKNYFTHPSNRLHDKKILQVNSMLFKYLLIKYFDFKQKPN